jgi:hypothetical protein
MNRRQALALAAGSPLLGSAPVERIRTTRKLNAQGNLKELDVVCTDDVTSEELSAFFKAEGFPRFRSMSVSIKNPGPFTFHV